MADEPQIQTKLPENAYRELKPGEKYVPMIPPNVTAPELTTRSIIFGIIMNIVFAMAATYLALKIGQGIETAIPISILAVGLSGFLIKFGLRGSSLIENVNVLAIGTTSGIVAGGTVFTMPAIYVLRLHENPDLGLNTFALFFQIFLVPFLGAVLGVLFLIPFRRYFVRDMHGKLPFPEATATNEILVTGSGGGSQALVLIYSFVIGMAYNWCSGAMKLWTETFSTASIPGTFFSDLTNKVKAVFSLGTGAEFMGLGFIIGVRFASIIVAGSFLSWFVIIPVLSELNLEQLQLLNGACEAHHGPQEDAPRFNLAAEFGDTLDAIGSMAPQPALCKDFRGNGIALSSDAVFVAEKRGDEWQATVAGQTYTFRQEDRACFDLPLEFAATLDRLDPNSGITDQERAELRVGLAEQFEQGDAEGEFTLSQSKPPVWAVEPGRTWSLSDGERLYVIEATAAGLTVTERIVAVYPADGDEALFTLAAAAVSSLDELDSQRPLFEEVRRAFTAEGITLADDMQVMVRRNGSDWRVKGPEQSFDLKRAVTEIAVYVGGQAEPQSTLTFDLASRINRLDKGGTINRYAHKELADKGITVADDAKVTVVQRGGEWHIADGEQTYVLRATKAEIAVFDDQEEPFGLPVALGGTLDRFDPRQILRKGICDEFAEHDNELTEDTTISITQSGNKWKVKSEKQTYIAELDEETNEISIGALLPGAEDVFFPIPRNIGIGCIFTAGLLSILKMSKVIATALTQALGGLFASKGRGEVQDRTDEDISYPVLMVIGLITAGAIWVYFRYVVLADMPNALQLSIISLALALGVAFIFTTVSAWAIAMISVTPISGMTVTTLIITAVVLLAVGLPTDDSGMLATLLVGGVVCTALSMAGTLVTEFKIGFWLGASPKKIQWSAIIAALLASAFVTGTIMVLAIEPGYDAKASTEALQAPQANMMASALKSFIGTGDVPWTMYGTGVVMALLLQLVGVSPLAFGLGMYLPMELNAPILCGAVVALLVKKSSRKEDLSKARSDMGILVASGLVAGAAIIGVLKSVLAIVDGNMPNVEIMDAMDLSAWVGEEATTNWYGLIAFVALGLFVFLNCLSARPPKHEAR